MEERMEIQETDWIEVCLRSPPVASRNPGKTSGKAPHREDPLHHDNKGKFPSSPNKDQLDVDKSG